MQTVCRYLNSLILIVFLLFFTQSLSLGANRLYFGGMSVYNDQTHSMMAMLSWDALEGVISQTEISTFRIYRKAGTGSYSVLAEISNELKSAAQLQALFMEPGEEQQRTEILVWLTRIDPGTNLSNFHQELHDILDPQSAEFNPLQVSLLSRYSRNVARALGRAYLDKTPGVGSYTYMITGLAPDDSETGPLGRIIVDCTAQTVLPEPSEFSNVLISECSEINRQIDHGRVHFNWNVPVSPEKMALRILIHGYDLYRSESSKGSSCAAADLRNSIPSGMVKVNNIPIVVAGNAPENGLDSYLAIDEGDFLSGGSALEPGMVYCYYLVARDLAGGYSFTAGPVKVTVPDFEPPVMPWNVESQQEMVENVQTQAIEPKLTLLWDQINNINYLKEYGDDRTICGSSADKVCYVEQNESCQTDTPFCVNLDVVKYVIFRCENFSQASVYGGVDSDGDLYPDVLEDEYGGDRCDKNLIPTSLPTELTMPGIIEIDQNDQNYIRTIDSGKKIMFFTDSIPQPDNYVYWYRIASQDENGNLSEMSPPLRAVLWDRSQPTVNNANIKIYHCDNNLAQYFSSGHEDCIRRGPDSDAVLSIFDETGLAARFTLYEKCTDFFKPIYSGNLFDGRRELMNTSIQDELYDYCNPYEDPCGPEYIVQFFDTDGLLIDESQAFSASLCGQEHAGCVVLEPDCSYYTIGIDGGTGYGVVHNSFMPVQICVDFEKDQCSRVYLEINGNMSPMATFCYPVGATGIQTVCLNEMVSTIVSSKICLGIQSFSPNHVGSGMTYLPCFTTDNTSKLKAKPQTPQIETIVQNSDSNNPEFNVSWGGQSEGIAAYILSCEGKSESYFKTFWGITPNDITLQFSAIIDTITIKEKYCFKVRAMNKALVMSDWSSIECKTWDQAVPVAHLKWPAIPAIPDGTSISDLSNPPEGVSITAFVLTGEMLPAIVLSKDIEPYLYRLINPPYLIGDAACEFYVGECRGENACTNTGPPDTSWTSSIFQCDMCNIVDQWNQVGKFVVYRQNQGKDFVQVSPLVDDIYCHGLGSTNIEDPLVHMVRLLDNGSTHAVGGELPHGDPDYVDLTGTLEGTDLNKKARLIFIDHYPVKAGTKVRYKVVSIDNYMEPDAVYTSNWLEISVPQ